MARKPRRSVRERRDERRAEQQRQRILIVVVVIAVIAAIAALIWIRQPRTNPEDVIIPESLSSPPEADGSAWGPVDAPVLVEEYSDFQ
jgi:hypothetical protein